MKRDMMDVADRLVSWPARSHDAQSANGPKRWKMGQTGAGLGSGKSDASPSRQTGTQSGASQDGPEGPGRVSLVVAASAGRSSPGRLPPVPERQLPTEQHAGTSALRACWTVAQRIWAQRHRRSPGSSGSRARSMVSSQGALTSGVGVERAIRAGAVARSTWVLMLWEVSSS